MKYYDQVVSDSVADTYNQLKSTNLKEFNKYQSYCFEYFKPIITWRASKYRNFANYEDLIQEGFEALCLALKSYKKEKGAFTWWADKYISTRIARSANAHSTVRIPIHKAKELPPIRMALTSLKLSEKEDFDTNPQSAFIKSEEISQIKKMIGNLPLASKEAIEMYWGIGRPEMSMRSIMKNLKMNKDEVFSAIELGKDVIRQTLVNQ